MEATLKPYVLDTVNSSIDRICKDLDSMTQEELDRSINGARSGFDFIYEVGVVNDLIAERLKGNNPASPFPEEEGKYLVAPDDMKDIEKLKSFLRQSAEHLVEALGDDLTREVPGFSGSVPAYQRVLFSAIHAMYHDGQLNYIQSMKGDFQVHW
jgi:hypothetical protein